MLAVAAAEPEELVITTTLEIDPTGQQWTSFSAGKVWDGYLYCHTGTGVGWGNGGILIVDVREPTQPAVVTYLAGYYTTRVMAFSGHYVYLFHRDPSLDGSNHALHVVDISDPAAPVVRDSVSLYHRLLGVEIYGDYAYLLTYDDGLHIMSISDPTHPTSVAWLPVSGWLLSLVPPAEGAGPGVGPILYVYSPRTDVGLHAVSILDPTAPYVIDSTTVYEPSALCTVGNTLAMVDQAEAQAQFVLLDGTDPFTELGSDELDWDITGGPSDLKVGAGSRHVYAREYGLGDFQVLDISTPSAPVQVAHCDSMLPYTTFTPTPTHVYVAGRDATSDLPTLVVAEALQVFRDVTWDNWAAAPIQACATAAIVGGYPDGRYEPTGPVTRDQMAVFVARALSGGDELVPAPPPTPSFDDVAPDHWAYKYVEYAAAQNIVAGYEGNLYQPDWSVTRGQMAVFIARALIAPLGDSGIPTASTEPTFPDVTSSNDWSWCYDHVEYIAAHDIASGYGDGYHPEYTVSRDQMAVFVARAFGLSF